MALATHHNSPGLVTFDGDVTLYDDGQSLVPSNPVIPRILWLLEHDVNVGIVTAAGYTDAARYHGRLFGLLEAIRDSERLSERQKECLIVVGGESSYMFQSAPGEEHLLRAIPREVWALEEMKTWTEGDVGGLLDIAEKALRDSVTAMRLDAVVLRKERAVGIVHAEEGGRFAREQLEEAVLAVQRTLEMTEVGKRLPFCAFNGGNDVFVDIGDKRLGVLCCQTFFGNVTGEQTLHIGDQFLSAGHNDFKVCDGWLGGGI